jgi:4'-phosphopantetheinyl transferase
MPPLLKIDRGEVHLWYGFVEDFVDAAELVGSRALMNPSERTRSDGFHFDVDRNRFVAARGALRRILSRYAPVAPERWQFGMNAFGRPHISGPLADADGLTFNLSHTARMIVVAVGRHCRLGVDAETTAQPPVGLEIADRFFAADEARDLRAQPAHLRQRRFMEYWTLKEAYTKARGEGLSVPLHQFGFVMGEHGGVELWIDACQPDVAQRWQVFQYWLNEQDVVSICAEPVSEAQVDVTVREVTPPLIEQLMAMRESRASARTGLVPSCASAPPQPPRPT